MRKFKNTEHDKKKYRDKDRGLPTWYYTGEEARRDWLKHYPTTRKPAGIDYIGMAYNFKKDGFAEYAGPGAERVYAFHRNVLEGIDLITIGALCQFARSGAADMELRLQAHYNDSEKHKNMRKVNLQILKEHNRTVKAKLKSNILWQS